MRRIDWSDSYYGYGLNEAHRKRYLLSGLIKCGFCHGAYTIVSTDRYGCANHRNRGTCSDALRIHRNELEERVLAGLKSKLMAPELVEEFIREYHTELNRLRAAEDAKRSASKRDLDTVQRKIDNIMGAIESGIFTETTRDRLVELEARRKNLERQPPPKKVPRLHPKLAEVYRQNVENLHISLNRPDTRVEAAQILGDLIDEVRLTPQQNGALKAELFGDLAAMLAYAQHEKKDPGSEKSGRELSLVAGGSITTRVTSRIRRNLRARYSPLPRCWIHSVDANRSNETRISISFNVMFSAYAENMSKPLWLCTRGSFGRRYHRRRRGGG